MRKIRAALHAATALAVTVTVALASTATAQPVGQPGTGPGLGAPPPTPPAMPGVNAVTLSGEEREILKDVEVEYGRYLDAAEQHHARMRAILRREFDSRIADLEKRYAERIASAEHDRSLRHLKTIELLEKFIAEHPNHEEFTPDAMFRLADLYLDKAEDDLDNAAADAEAIADYSRSLALWEDILARFPRYRQLPQTLYLLAYYGKTKDERRALQLFLALTCANKYKYTDPPPKLPTREEAIARTERKERVDTYVDCQGMPGADAELLRHAWVRGVADHHFTIPGELDESIAGYLKVVDGGKDSPLYAEALYKLAWSFYKRDFLIDSIKRFDESVVLYDEVVAQGKLPPLELRDESIQYIAVAFTDPWEGETDTDPVKAMQRAKDFYKGRENEPHVRDVWVAMGAAFMELQAYDQAVDSYRVALGPPWELHPDNPLVHQEILNAYELKGDKYAADQAAAELATRYAPGSAWYTANEKDRVAMENQRRIAERALYAAAVNTHNAATTLRREYEDGGKKEAVLREEYMGLYSRAVELYKTFILQYPESDYVYKFTFLMGEALYFSERYMEAVEQYKWVRDHRDLSEEHFLDAAKSVLSAYEAEAAREVAAGRLTALKVPTGEELKQLPQPLSPQPIPDIYLRLQSEWDAYQNIVNDPQTAPQQGINAALVSLAYLHIDDAIARFEKVLAKFCGTPEAVRAKDGLLSIYDATGQLDKFEQTNNRFIQTKCGDATSIELAKSQNRSIEFKRANQLYEDKQYVAAAEGFYRYYKTAPPGDADLPTALYNAAVSYKLAERPKTAISLFKEFTANKDPAFRSSPFYLKSMELTAKSYQDSYDYKSAIAGYLSLYETSKAFKKRGAKPPDPLPGEQPKTFDQISLDALFNAALIAELDRDFKQSLALYAKYDAEEPNRRNSDRAVWSTARIYRSSGDVLKLTETYDKWRRTYGKDAGNEDDYVQSFYDVAVLWQKKGRTSNAERTGALAVTAWADRGSPKNTRGARMAGEWALVAADKHYSTKFEPYKVTQVAKTIAESQKIKANLEKLTLQTQDKYAELDKFGVAEYSMAYKVRYGETLARFAEKLAQTPTPKYVLDLQKRNPDSDAIAVYEEGLAKNLKKYIDEAKAQWVEVVDLAKKNGVSNRWTQLALENLNREFPDEYPVLHQELFVGTEDP
jgi:hypothetical protein